MSRAQRLRNLRKSTRHATVFARGVGLLGLILWGLALPGVGLGAEKSVAVLSGRDPGPTLRALLPSAIAEPRFESVRPLLQARQEGRILMAETLGPHPMSEKGLARRDARIRRLLKAPGLAEPETLKVLLIRIAFEEDRDNDLSSITEDGNFLLEPDSTILFDPPPHDRRYFEAHLTALGEYWKSMSGGLVVADTRVLPAGDQDAYFLSDLADYGPGRGGFWSIELLEKLVEDMILAADNGTQSDGSGVSLADYDIDDPNTHIIFAHAGADLQSNLVFTEGQEGYSPNDIPTFFVVLGDSAQVDLSSTDSETGRPGRIRECSVVPETTSQDGLVGSISAALYHEFGHALGLPDLYSTYTGLPTVGYWDLMDSGTNLTAVVGVLDEDGEVVPEFVTGLLPPQTGIWSKWFLGFVDEIRAGSSPVNVSLPASFRQDRRDQVLRIDVSPNEFFLVENRFIPPVGEANWRLISDPNGSGVIQYLGIVDENNDVVGNTHMYDFFLPWQAGLMVYRVRQDRVEAGMATNTVQAFPEELGIELIEADGIQDIGVFDFTTRGFYGSDNDAFRDLSSFVYADTTIVWPATATEFSETTLPSSESGLRIPTGVRLSAIGPSDPGGATVTASIEGLVDVFPGPGFPLEIDAVGGELARGDAMSLTALTLAGEAALVFAVGPADSSSPPGLYAFDLGGAPALDAARIADLSGVLAGPPVALPQAAPAAPSLVTLSRSGTFQFFTFGAGTGLPTEFAVDLAADFDASPIVISDGAFDYAIAASVTQNRMAAVSTTGVVVNQDFGLGDSFELRSPPVTAVVADDAGTMRSAIAFASSRGLDVRGVGGGRTASAFPVSYPDGIPGGETGTLLAMPSSEADQSDRFVFVSGGGRLVVFESDASGVWSSRFLGGRLESAPVEEPAVADLDGDGEQDVVVFTRDTIWARHLSGAELLGFPQRLSELLLVADAVADSIASNPIVADVDGDGHNELLFVSGYGVLHALEANGGRAEGYPRKVSGGGAIAPLLFDYDAGDGAQRALGLFESLGDTLDSGRRSRPARLNLAHLGPAPTEAPGARPAEWLGRGGGSERFGRGVVGAAAADGGVLAASSSREARVFPNPLRSEDGTLAFLRIFSGAPQTAKITVFNLEGQEVTRLSRDVVAVDQPVEIEWDTRGLVSGPYLCRIEYAGADGPRTDLLTLYIER